MVKKILIAVIASVALSACHKTEKWDADVYGNFDALWTIIDEHYCFFDQKDIDWDAVYSKYHKRLGNDMTAREFFDICSDMLAELKDGHVNLSSSFDVSYYRNWWSDYPQNYDSRLIEQYYLDFDYSSASGMKYAVLPQNVGYINYQSFSYMVGEGALDAILYSFSPCRGLIIDIRDNGGGDMTNVETIVRRFIDEKILAGYISHKTGPGHSDFSKPYAYYFDPAPAGRRRWLKPVVVLTNRSTFSAANNFVSIMKLLPNVKIVGDRTGGGSGMPFSSEIPCGWGVRFSACSVLDALGQSTESGIEPSPGCKVDLDPVKALQGTDTMLDKAIEVLLGE